MNKYHTILKKEIKKFKSELNAEYRSSFQEIMDNFLKRYTNSYLYWLRVILFGAATNLTMTSIALPILLIGLALFLTGWFLPVVSWPLVIAGGSIIVVGALFIIPSFLIGFFTINEYTFYRLGRANGRLTQKCKGMINRFPEYKYKVQELQNKKNILLSPRLHKFATTTVGAFKRRVFNKNNVFLLDALNVFDNSDTSGVNMFNIDDPDSGSDKRTENSVNSDSSIQEINGIPIAQYNPMGSSTSGNGKEDSSDNSPQEKDGEITLNNLIH